MAKKRKVIMWSDDLMELCRDIALAHSDDMLAIGIDPYTGTTGSEDANASGIIEFALLYAAQGKVPTRRLVTTRTNPDA